MRRGAAAIGLLLVAGCSYHNVLYNAGDLFEEGEAARRAGQDSLAAARYRDVVRKTGDALRSRPESGWAPDALLLLGRARLRLGLVREARAALVRIPEDDPPRWAAAQVLLAAAESELGARDAALARVNRAFETELPDEVRTEAHLLRGRLLLDRGLYDHGAWDLDRAAEAGAGERVEAALERLRWTVERGTRSRAEEAFAALLADSRAGSRADTVVALAARAASRWDHRAAASMLAGVSASDWDRSARGAVALARAEHLDAAGDTAEARRQAAAIAEGLGVVAADARLLLAGWRIERARDLDGVYATRRLLLPAGADPRATAQLDRLDRLERFIGVGLDEPLGWFAAGEVARDELGAEWVARGLFLAYADGAPDSPWAPKALLAALQLSPDEGDRAWLRGRLEAHSGSPYVLAAVGRAAADYQELEEELDVRLRELSQR